MEVLLHWETDSDIIEILFIEFSRHVWIITKSGNILIYNEEGVFIFNIETNNTISCAKLIDQTPQAHDGLPILRVWCGQISNEGKNFISLWNAMNGFEVCTTNLSDSSTPIQSIAQYQNYVLIATHYKIFAYKFTPKFLASWRICHDSKINKIHIINSETQNLWISMYNSSSVKIWDCSSRNLQLILTDPEICINYKGRINCIQQIKYKPQNIETVWNLVSQDSQNHSIIIRNSGSMSVLQEIKLSDDKGGTCICLLGEYIFVATSSEATLSSNILCFGFDL